MDEFGIETLWTQTSLHSSTYTEQRLPKRSMWVAFWINGRPAAFLTGMNSALVYETEQFYFVPHNESLPKIFMYYTHCMVNSGSAVGEGCRLLPDSRFLVRVSPRPTKSFIPLGSVN